MITKEQYQEALFKLEDAITEYDKVIVILRELKSKHNNVQKFEETDEYYKHGAAAFAELARKDQAKEVIKLYKQQTIEP